MFEDNASSISKISFAHEKYVWMKMINEWRIKTDVLYHILYTIICILFCINYSTMIDVDIVMQNKVY